MSHSNIAFVRTVRTNKDARNAVQGAAVKDSHKRPAKAAWTRSDFKRQQQG